MKTIYCSVPLPNYLDALHAAGLTPTDEPARADALLLPGGGDLHPRLYGQSSAGCDGIDEARDAHELSLVEAFAAQEKPIFGICRGLQVLNVAFGGTLHRHIDGHSQIGGIDRLHETYTDDPLMRSLYGERFLVNSAHHQSADRLGSGLCAVQWANDGTVEALRHRTLPLFAVQWHPERLCGKFARSGAVDGLVLLREFFSAW